LVRDQAGHLENGEVLGHRRRSEAEDRLNLAHAQATALEQLQDAGPGWIPSSFEDEFKVAHLKDCFHHFVTCPYVGYIGEARQVRRLVLLSQATPLVSFSPCPRWAPEPILAQANMKTAISQNQVDRTFRAFSDRTRLRILHLLQDGELCVGDLVEVLQVPQPTASRHLAYLRKSGLVITRKEGLWSHYSLAPVRNAFHGKLLECLGECFGDVPELARDRARAKRLRRAGGCCPR